MSVPNQKLIFIDREKVNTTQKSRRFLMVYTDNINTAYTIMKGEKCFGLYLYLLERIPHLYNGQKIENAPPKLELYEKNVIAEMGISDTTYQRSVNTLIKLGFLEQIKGNLYNFYEMPKKYRARTYKEYIEDEEIKAMSIEESQQILQKRHAEELKQQVIEEQLNSSPTLSQEIKETTREPFRAQYNWETNDEYLQKKRTYESRQ